MRHRLVEWWCKLLLRLASGGWNFSVRRSSSCPSKLLTSSDLHQSVPDLQTIIRYPPCFYLLLPHSPFLFQSQIPSCLFVFFLNDCLPLSAHFSHFLCWETVDVGRPLPLKRSISLGWWSFRFYWVENLNLNEACDRCRPHWTSLCCVKVSSLNLK